MASIAARAATLRAEFREELHRRDARGRFADKPDAEEVSRLRAQEADARRRLREQPRPSVEGQYKNATELFDATYDPHVDENALLDAIPGARERVIMAEAANRGPDTQTQYLVNGKYTPERVAIHNQLLAEMFTDGAIRNATPRPGERPTFTVLGGRGGSGKSWFTEDVTSPVSEIASRSIIVNSDNFKERLPEYTGLNANLVHEESSDLTSRAIDIARRSGLNVIFDGTVRSTGTVGRYISEFKEAGYRVNGYYMHAAPQTAALRALGRFVKMGRYVPVSYVLGSTSNERSFDSLSGEMDDWEVYSSDHGFPPKFIVRKRR